MRLLPPGGRGLTLTWSKRNSNSVSGRRRAERQAFFRKVAEVWKEHGALAVVEPVARVPTTGGTVRTGSQYLTNT